MITARDVHDRFKCLSGSEYIASEDAVAGLIRVLRRHKPQRILEVGSGIGTLTFAIISTMDEVRCRGYRLVMVENNDYCRAQLAVNLAGKIERGTLVHDVGEISDGKFDLIIVDGGAETDGRYLNMLSPRGMIFVEGYREPQRRLIEASRPSFVRALYRSMQMDRSAAHHARSAYGGAGRWGGGYWVYQFQPTWLEQLQYFLAHLWHGVLVTKRRRLKRLGLSLLGDLGIRRGGKASSTVQS
jgi:protein-L-isoaspartate O-methyltransferase